MNFLNGFSHAFFFNFCQTQKGIWGYRTASRLFSIMAKDVSSFNAKFFSGAKSPFVSPHSSFPMPLARNPSTSSKAIPFLYSGSSGKDVLKNIFRSKNNLYRLEKRRKEILIHG